MEIYSFYLHHLVDFIPFNQFIKYIHCQNCKKILIDKIIEYNEEVCECEQYSCFICSALIKRFLMKYLYKIKCNQCRYSNNSLIINSSDLLNEFNPTKKCCKLLFASL